MPQRTHQLVTRVARDADIPKEFKQAIDKIVFAAPWILYNLKERVYKNYVLQRIEAAEAGETTFLWTPLEFGKNARANDLPKDVYARLQKWVLFVDDENDYLFCTELHMDKVSIVLLPSTNREDVLRTVRSHLPGKETEQPLASDDSPGTIPSTSTASTSSAAAEGPSGFGSLPIQDTVPSPDAPPSASTSEADAIATLHHGDGSQFMALLDSAARKAADQMLAAFQPRIDDLVRRMDALAAKRTSTAKAKDRHQDPRTEQWSHSSSCINCVVSTTPLCDTKSPHCCDPLLFVALYFLFFLTLFVSFVSPFVDTTFDVVSADIAVLVVWPGVS